VPVAVTDHSGGSGSGGSPPGSSSGSLFDSCKTNSDEGPAAVSSSGSIAAAAVAAAAAAAVRMAAARPRTHDDNGSTEAVQQQRRSIWQQHSRGPDLLLHVAHGVVDSCGELGGAGAPRSGHGAHVARIELEHRLQPAGGAGQGRQAGVAGEGAGANGAVGAVPAPQGGAGGRCCRDGAFSCRQAAGQAAHGLNQGRQPVQQWKRGCLNGGKPYVSPGSREDMPTDSGRPLMTL
jgi:hypothetical protein